jgi:acetyl esterase/lipase
MKYKLTYTTQLRVITLLFISLYSIRTWSQEPIHIWKDIKKGSSQVVLTPYLPLDNNSKRIAVIICPGGSYCWLDNKNERTTVAKWLQREGIAAFVLQYRTSGIPAFITHYRLLVPHNEYPAMIQDVQQTIHMLRLHATNYGIDPNKIGIMGFSAGAHLAILSAELAHIDFRSSMGLYSTVSLHPNFIAAIYPVVTLSDKRFVHKRSRRGLLGEWKKNSKIMRDSLSIEKHITPDLPPVFLVNCIDDPIVKYQNSILLDSALTAKHIPHLYLKYKTGGHGFGSNPKPFTEAITWKKEFVNWIKKIGV